MQLSESACAVVNSDVISDTINQFHLVDRVVTFFIGIINTMPQSYSISNAVRMYEF